MKRKITTCNRWDLEALGSWLSATKNLQAHGFLNPGWVVRCRRIRIPDATCLDASWREVVRFNADPPTYALASDSHVESSRAPGSHTRATLVCPAKNTSPTYSPEIQGKDLSWLELLGFLVWPRSQEARWRRGCEAREYKQARSHDASGGDVRQGMARCGVELRGRRGES